METLEKSHPSQNATTSCTQRQRHYVAERPYVDALPISTWRSRWIEIAKHWKNLNEIHAANSFGDLFFFCVAFHVQRGSPSGTKCAQHFDSCILDVFLRFFSKKQFLLGILRHTFLSNRGWKILGQCCLQEENKYIINTCRNGITDAIVLNAKQHYSVRNFSTPLRFVSMRSWISILAFFMFKIIIFSFRPDQCLHSVCHRRIHSRCCEKIQCKPITKSKTKFQPNTILKWKNEISLVFEP